MKLEAIDPEKPALICAVSVVDVLGEGNTSSSAVLIGISVNSSINAFLG